jgi:hypothetical protein
MRRWSGSGARPRWAKREDLNLTGGIASIRPTLRRTNSSGLTALPQRPHRK